MNLIEALVANNAKSREFLVELEETAKALGHASASDEPGLNASKVITETMIAESERVIATGDVVAMVKFAQAQGIGG